MSEPEYPCTECKGDAFVGVSDFHEVGVKQLVGKDERLCMKCAKKRGVPQLIGVYK